MVEVVRGWPVQDTPLEVTFLLYTGSVGLIRSLLQLFPTHRSAIVEYLRDMADCIESSTW